MVDAGSKGRGDATVAAVADALREPAARAARIAAAGERHALLHLLGVLDVLCDRANARGDVAELESRNAQVFEVEMRLGLGG